jgi:hypothetical protein
VKIAWAAAVLVLGTLERTEAYHSHCKDETSHLRLHRIERAS